MSMSSCITAFGSESDNYSINNNKRKVWIEKDTDIESANNIFWDSPLSISLVK